MDAQRFIDEFRPFRRGELGLARKRVSDPGFLPGPQLDALRYALRLAQLSALGPGGRSCVEALAGYRLDLLQLLAPVLPTDPDEIDAAALAVRVPAAVRLVETARRRVLETPLVDADTLERDVTHKPLVLLLGGAAGCGYVYLGALQRLAELALLPSYIVGCSIGAILAVLRARTADFSLAEVYAELRALRRSSVLQRRPPPPRYTLPGPLQLNLRDALGHLFRGTGGDLLRLDELAIPVDVLVTGVGRGARGSGPAQPAETTDPERRHSLTRLPLKLAGRALEELTALAMSRRLVTPLFLGADANTAGLPALDAAGFSACIPQLIHYEPPADATDTARIVEELFERHDLEALADGVVSTTTPARMTWEAIEGGRLGSRSCAILALNAMQAGRGPTRLLLAPLQHAFASRAQLDKPFWDLGVSFRHGASLIDLLPSESTLRRATRTGRREFEPTAVLLGALLAPLPDWPEIRARASMGT